MIFDSNSMQPIIFAQSCTASSTGISFLASRATTKIRQLSSYSMPDLNAYHLIDKVDNEAYFLQRLMIIGKPTKKYATDHATSTYHLQGRLMLNIAVG